MRVQQCRIHDYILCSEIIGTLEINLGHIKIKSFEAHVESKLVGNLFNSDHEMANDYRKGQAK
jgi:hypothetical protein